MKKDWTEQLRGRMTDYEAVSPEGLWADIERALPRQKAAVTLLWRRWVSAAAVVALLAGVGFWLWPDTSPSPRPHTTLATVPDTQKHQTVCTDSTDHVDSQPRQWRLLTQKGQKSQPVTEGTGESSESEHASQQSLDRGDGSPDPSSQGDCGQENRPHEPRHIAEEPLRHEPPKTHNRTSAIQIGLMADHGLLAYSHSNGVRMSDEMASLYDHSSYLPTRAPAGDEVIWLTDYEERQHHDHPFSLGLTVSWPFSKRWSLGSGLVYTRLHSEFESIVNQSGIKTDQTLHYVGIPLNMQYRVVGGSHWKAYATAGMQADWNVRAKSVIEVVETNMNRDRLQWSVGLAVGIEYDVVPQLGIYAEPGFRYYFDNGSRVQNFFKDQPACWTLQFGIRLNVK